MRRAWLLVALLALGACAPALAPHAARDGEQVLITLTPIADVYAVTLSVLNATTDDARCAVLGGTDLGCALGDLAAGTTTTVLVTGPIGAVGCRAFGYTSPDKALATYRTFACN